MQAHARSLRSLGFISITFLFLQPLSLLPRRYVQIEYYTRNTLWSVTLCEPYCK